MTTEQFKKAYDLQKEKQEIQKHLQEFEDQITAGKKSNGTKIYPAIYNSWKTRTLPLEPKFCLIDFDQFCELYKTKAEKRLKEIATEFDNL